jgi:hypothetical protein
MAMGKRKPRQESLFVPADRLAEAPGHPFRRCVGARPLAAERLQWTGRPTSPQPIRPADKHF